MPGRTSPTLPPPGSEAGLPPSPRFGGHVLFGMIVVVFGFFGLVAWLLTATLSGAVMAVGQVVVEANVKRIQHQMGGIVGEIRVHEGQQVEAGELLVRLDDTLARTNLAQIEFQLTQLHARRARLEAERDGLDNLSLPPDFEAGGSAARDIATRERRLLAENRVSRVQQANQLEERIGQFESEVVGLTAQVDSKARELELITVELVGVQELYDKKLVSLTRISALQREAARLGGERGALMASIAKARGQIAEIRLQLISLEQRVRAEAVKELAEIAGHISQLVERRVAALDILQRIDIRAPQAGIVHESKVHTVGGVIAPGDTIMMVVPNGGQLAVEVKVSPLDIDQLKLGQAATLRLSALNQRTTPEFVARISRIAADASRDPMTGQMFFLARIDLDFAKVSRVAGHPLSPGMPVEAFIETAERTALTYFAKPLTDAFHRAFREE